MIWFAAFILGEPLDPWEQWAVIHLGELLADGRPRFRQVLIIVARQNGKTHLCKVLALYWLFVERQAMVFGTSTNLEQAKEAWEFAVELAQQTPALAGRVRSVRIGNGQQVLSTTDRCRYKIGAADRKGGRGKTIRRAIGDELREQHSWEAYNAVTFATNAVPDAQIVYITNQGDARAVVLTSLRKSALEFIETGEGDPRLGLLEWSAPDGTHPNDPAGWAAANPQLGRRRAGTGELCMDPSAIAGAAARVSKPGADPEELAGFLTEVLCMRVANLNAALDMKAWADQCKPATLDAYRGRVALVLDVAPDLRHAILVAAAVQADGKVRVESVASWDDVHAAGQAVAGWVERVRPYAFGWFPGGPAAALLVELADNSKRGRRGWPPRGTRLEPIRAETPAVCMGYAELVRAGQVVHSGQELLTAHHTNAQKLATGREQWVFGGEHVNGAYAAAGAAHLARVIPAPREPTGLRVVPD